MAILVDEARWPWRDTYWCHLVSDTDLVELHDFARELGCRRVGFQGDHYDIDVVSREQAIALGAEPCESRELVRRLKGAGLRLRPSQFRKWSMVARGGAADLPVDVKAAGIDRFVEHADGFFALRRARADGAMASAIVLFGSELCGNGPLELPPEDNAKGRYVRIDRDGGWAIEMIDPPPTPQE